MTRKTWDEERDVVVVGSGGGGMVAAITAASRGYTSLVLEKESKWGGTSAYSGGGMWMPNNPLMQADGAGDSRERALTYMDAVIDYTGPASSPARREAFVDAAPKVVEFLSKEGFEFVRAEEYPDYYPDKPGGMIGRGVEGKPFNGKKLGPWRKTLAAAPGTPAVAMTTRDTQYLPVVTRTWKGFVGTMKMALRTAWWMLTGREPLGIGQAFLGSLMHIAQKRGVQVWLNSPMVELVEEDGRVTGVVIERNGQRQRIRARVGVMLTAGGFAKNDQMRRTYQAVGSEYTSVSPGDTGDAILAGGRLQAATELMDDAWWGPTFMMPNGNPAFAVYERGLPGCILVDANGKRFANESASYVDVGHAMLDLPAKDGAVAETWLIMDAKHRKHYLMGMTPPGITPKEWFESGFLKRADSLEDLAVQCGIDAAGLRATVERFNGFAKSGKDLDFHRGDTAYDTYYGDSSVKPNANLAPIENAPFYAARMVPGDLGTKGGLVTDEHARVLRTDGSPIEGLYAAGNTTASVMGRTYPGPGSTLGPSVTFAWLGALDAIHRFEARAESASAAKELA